MSETTEIVLPPYTQSHQLQNAKNNRAREKRLAMKKFHKRQRKMNAQYRRKT